MVGTGRPGTGTDGWDYRYVGHLIRNWPNGPPDQRPALVGSVMRRTTHNGRGQSPAGEVLSFIAVKQQPLTWELSGSWTYLSFENKPEPVYQKPPQQQHLIWLEAAFKLETPTSPTGLEGTLEWSGGGLNLKGTVQLPERADSRTVFNIVGTGRPRTDTAGWEYHYHGVQMGRWPPPAKSDQIRTLGGSVIRVQGEGATAGYVAPFIAVEQR
jgi:hypothetical protein